MVKKSVKKEIVWVAPEEQKFWVNDGRVLRDLNELVSALEEMSDDTYSHHVNSKRNDFSNWIKDVLQNDKLALQVAKSKSRKAVIAKIKSSLKGME